MLVMFSQYGSMLGMFSHSVEVYEGCLASLEVC